MASWSAEHVGSDGIYLVPFQPEDSQTAELFVKWVVSEAWDGYVNPHPSSDEVRRRLASGFYAGPDVSTWLLRDSAAGKRASPIGLLRLYDLTDPGILFDLMVSSSRRGQGLGTQVVRWLPRFVFGHFPAAIRLEGRTRADNVAMRIVLMRAGFVKEAHFRASWPAGDQMVDTVAYAMLRSDFEGGTTTPVLWDDEPSR